MASTVVRLSQATSSPSKKPAPELGAQVEGSATTSGGCPGASSRRAASLRMRWRTATGAIESSGPGPPLAASDEVTTSVCPSLEATPGARPGNIRSVTRTWAFGSAIAMASGER